MTRAGMQDVARAAGVGASTVPRVLNNHPHISARSRERVLAAVEALGYTPDLNARSLRSGRTGARVFASTLVERGSTHRAAP